MRHKQSELNEIYAKWEYKGEDFFPIEPSTLYAVIVNNEKDARQVMTLTLHGNPPEYRDHPLVPLIGEAFSYERDILSDGFGEWRVITDGVKF